MKFPQYIFLHYSELLSTVEAYKPSQVKRYEPGDPAKFGVHIDRLMNYKSKTT